MVKSNVVFKSSFYPSINRPLNQHVKKSTQDSPWLNLKSKRWICTHCNLIKSRNLPWDCPASTCNLLILPVNQSSDERTYGVQRLRVWAVADFGDTSLSHKAETTCETRWWITHNTRYCSYPMLTTGIVHGLTPFLLLVVKPLKFIQIIEIAVLKFSILFCQLKVRI